MTIGQRLKSARERAGIDQLTAAKKAGLSAPSLSRTEKAKDVKWSTIVKLCKVYRLTVIELLQLNT